jgi:hypothetical protein
LRDHHRIRQHPDACHRGSQEHAAANNPSLPRRRSGCSSWGVCPPSLRPSPGLRAAPPESEHVHLGGECRRRRPPVEAELTIGLAKPAPTLNSGRVFAYSKRPLRQVGISPAGAASPSAQRRVIIAVDLEQAAIRSPLCSAQPGCGSWPADT